MTLLKLNYREFYARTGSYFETSDCNASVLAKEEMWQYLRDIDKALLEAKSLIESCGYAEIPVPEYDVHAEAIDKAESDMEVLASFPQDLCNGLYDQTDKEFFKAINEKVENVLDLIKMDEITIKNDFDVMQTKYVGKDGLPQTLKKHELCISDFLGYNMFGETKSTPIEGFTDILYKPFMTDDMTLMGYVSANQKELHDLIYSGEYDAKKYQPLRQLASDVLDALSLGVIPIVKSMSGYDVITGEHLSDEERMAYFVEGAITIVMFGFDAASAAMPLIRQFMVSSVANGAGQLAGSGMELALKDVDMPDDVKFTLVMLANAGVNITVEKGLVKIGSEVVNPKELAKLQAEMGCETSYGGTYSAFGEMSEVDGKAYDLFWEQVASSEPRWGERPNPEMLYSGEYIETHIQNFEQGGSYLVSKDVYDARIADDIKNPFLGRPGELFISTTDEIDSALIKSNGNLAELEKIMGFDEGWFSKHGGVVRIDIKDPLSYEIRLPSGNEYGANAHFVPGGKTDGGALESVINNVPNEDGCRNITINAYESIIGVK